jgi:hypothetical protein
LGGEFVSLVYFLGGEPSYLLFECFLFTNPYSKHIYAAIPLLTGLSIWVSILIPFQLDIHSNFRYQSVKEIEQKIKSESKNEKKERESAERKGKTKVSFYARE